MEFLQIKDVPDAALHHAEKCNFSIVCQRLYVLIHAFCVSQKSKYTADSWIHKTFEELQQGDDVKRRASLVSVLFRPAPTLISQVDYVFTVKIMRLKTVSQLVHGLSESAPIRFIDPYTFFSRFMLGLFQNLTNMTLQSAIEQRLEHEFHHQLSTMNMSDTLKDLYQKNEALLKQHAELAPFLQHRSQWINFRNQLTLPSKQPSKEDILTKALEQQSTLFTQELKLMRQKLEMLLQSSQESTKILVTVNRALLDEWKTLSAHLVASTKQPPPTVQYVQAPAQSLPPPPPPPPIPIAAAPVSIPPTTRSIPAQLQKQPQQQQQQHQQKTKPEQLPTSKLVTRQPMSAFAAPLDEEDDRPSKWISSTPVVGNKRPPIVIPPKRSNDNEELLIDGEEFEMNEDQEEEPPLEDQEPEEAEPPVTQRNKSAIEQQLQKLMSRHKPSTAAGRDQDDTDSNKNSGARNNESFEIDIEPAEENSVEKSSSSARRPTRRKTSSSSTRSRNNDTDEEDDEFRDL